MRVQVEAGASPYDVTDESTLPVTHTDVKALGRIDGSDEDELIKSFILEATEHAEKYTRRALVNREFTLKVDKVNDSIFAGGGSLMGNQVDIYLPKGKIQSVTSVTVYDDDNVGTDYTGYQLDDNNGRIVLKDGVYWQNAQRNVAAIEVVYTAGYGASPASIPFGLRMIIRKHALSLYENREGCADISKAICKELSPFRIVRLDTFAGVNRYMPNFAGRGL
jgi:uncharacterized phiE125 gp8 family phage protein